MRPVHTLTITPHIKHTSDTHAGMFFQQRLPTMQHDAQACPLRGGRLAAYCFEQRTLVPIIARPPKRLRHAIFSPFRHLLILPPPCSCLIEPLRVISLFSFVPTSHNGRHTPFLPPNRERLGVASLLFCREGSRACAVCALPPSGRQRAAPRQALAQKNCLRPLLHTALCKATMLVKLCNSSRLCCIQDEAAAGREQPGSRSRLLVKRRWLSTASAEQAARSSADGAR